MIQINVSVRQKILVAVQIGRRARLQGSVKLLLQTLTHLARFQINGGF